MPRQRIVDSVNFLPDARGTGPIIERYIPPGRKIDENGGPILYKTTGFLGFCDKVNGNRRKYPRSVWERNLAEDSLLRKELARRRTIGLLEHPGDNEVVNLRSPISHIVTDVKLNEDGSITGDLVFLNTAEGQKMKALMEAGFQPTVSSRGFGTLVRGADGIDIVDDDYVCESWDVVMTPSFTEAIQHVAESTSSGKSTAPRVVETTAPTQQVSADNGPKSGETQIPAGITPRTHKPMEVNTSKIRESITPFAGMDVRKMEPSQIAEGLRNLEALHEQAEQVRLADPTKSWEVSRLHEQITGIQNSWTSAINEDRQKVATTNESLVKTASVLEAVIAQASKLKTKALEAMGVNKRLLELNEKNLTRGRRWKQIAESSQGKLTETETKLEIATLALTKISNIHKSTVKEHDADLVKLGRRLYMFEFAEALKDPELLKKLNEMKTSTEIGDFRKVLEEKSKPASSAPAVNDSKTTDDKVTESKTPAANPAPAATPKVTEAVGRQAVTINGQEAYIATSGSNGPRRLSESVALIRRMSEQNNPAVS